MMKTFSATLLSIILLISCVGRGRARDFRFSTYVIHSKGLSDEHIQQIQATLLQLEALTPNKIRTSKATYRRLSHFKDLFGFSFDGPDLVRWLLRRVRQMAYQNTWTVAVNRNRGDFVLGDVFFAELDHLERLYLLIHEARHSDGGGYPHVRCPAEFPFISAAQPNMDLPRALACDAEDNGAYAYQAAFLFELYVRGLLDPRAAGLLYNSSIARVLPRIEKK